MKMSARRRTAGPRPCPSLPMTIASGPRRSASRAVSGASPRRRRSAGRGRGGRLSAPGRSSTGASSRCSTAPAEAFTAAGRSGAWRWVGKITPWTPAASALRSRRPDVLRVLERVEDEDEWRLATLGRPGQDVVEAGHTAAARPRARSPGGRRSRRGRSAIRPRPRRSGCGDSSRGERASRAPRDAAAPRAADGPSRRATNASSTGRRPATSSSPSESASGAGSEPTAGCEAVAERWVPRPRWPVRGPLVEPRRPSVCGWGSRATASVRRSIGISRRPGRPVVAERHIRRPPACRSGGRGPGPGRGPGRYAPGDRCGQGPSRRGPGGRSGRPDRSSTVPTGSAARIAGPVGAPGTAGDPARGGCRRIPDRSGPVLARRSGSSRRPVPVGPGATWAIRTLATGSGPASSVAALVPSRRHRAEIRRPARGRLGSVRRTLPPSAAAGASAAGPTSARRATTTSRPAAIGPPTPEVTTARSAAIRAGLAGLPVLGRTFSHRS